MYSILRSRFHLAIIASVAVGIFSSINFLPSSGVMVKSLRILPMMVFNESMRTSCAT